MKPTVKSNLDLKARQQNRSCKSKKFAKVRAFSRKTFTESSVGLTTNTSTTKSSEPTKSGTIFSVTAFRSETEISEGDFSEVESLKLTIWNFLTLGQNAGNRKILSKTYRLLRLMVNVARDRKK